MTERDSTQSSEQAMETMPPILAKSSDILFLMDATLTNPNGDPYENIPRRSKTGKGDFGEITGGCLGQTIRGYLKKRKINEQDAKCFDIFVDREADVLSAGEAFTNKFVMEEKELKDQGSREAYLKDKFLQRYIDVRLFGALITIQEKSEEKLKKMGIKFKQNSIQYTGPVQPGSLGQTVHPIVIQKVPITSAFRSKEGSGGAKDPEQGTRGEKWVVNYGLYQFTPVIDATLANQTKMTVNDKDLFIEALWSGIKTRVSGSKANQLPLLYVEIVYLEGIKGRIGRLSDFVDYKCTEPQRIRDIQIDITKLISVVKTHSQFISGIRIIEDKERLNLNAACQFRKIGVNVSEGNSVTGKFDDAQSQMREDKKPDESGCV